MSEKCGYVRCIMIDFSREFDVVDHATVLGKVSMLKLPDSVNNWIVSLLCNRVQCVKLAEQISQLRPINRRMEGSLSCCCRLFVLVITFLLVLCSDLPPPVMSRDVRTTYQHSAYSCFVFWRVTANLRSDRKRPGNREDPEADHERRGDQRTEPDQLLDHVGQLLRDLGDQQGRVYSSISEAESTGVVV